MRYFCILIYVSRVNISNRPTLISPYQTLLVTIENALKSPNTRYVDRLLIIVAPGRRCSLGIHVVWGVMNVLEGQAIFSIGYDVCSTVSQ